MRPAHAPTIKQAADPARGLLVGATAVGGRAEERVAIVIDLDSISPNDAEFLLDEARQPAQLAGSGGTATSRPGLVINDDERPRQAGRLSRHTEIASKQVLRKGLSPLATTISTAHAAPVIAGMRLRAAKTGSGKGAGGASGRPLG